MQSNRENDNTEKTKAKKRPWYHPTSILKFLRKVDYLHTGAASLLGLEKFIPQLEKLQANLGFLSIFLTIITIPINLFGVTYGLFFSQENKLNRFIRVAMAAIGIALTAISIIAAAGLIAGAGTILMMVGAAKGLFESVLRTGLAVFDRFFGKGAKDAAEIKTLREKILDNWPNPYDKDLTKLEELTNAQRKRNQAIARGVHVIAMNVIGVIAVGLLFSGITAAAGTGILIGLGIYGSADGIGLNPIKLSMRFINWTSRKIRGKPVFDPFAKKNKDELRAELAEEYAKRSEAKVKLEKSSNAKQDPASVKEGNLQSEAKLFKKLLPKPLPSKPLPHANDSVIMHESNHPDDHANDHAALIETVKIVMDAAGERKKSSNDVKEEDGDQDEPHSKPS